jgi:hypothetical protein
MFVAHAQMAQIMKFQENGNNGSWDIEAKAPVVQVTYPYLFINCNQAYIFEAQAQMVPHFKFQENISNGSRDTAEVFHWTRIVSVLLTDRNKLKAFAGFGRKVRQLMFQGNPYNGRAHTDEKVLCSSNKVPFNIDWMQPQLPL